MLARSLRVGLLFACLGATAGRSPGQTPDFTGHPKEFHSPSLKIRWRLVRRFDKVEISKAPLTLLDALECLAERYDVPIDVMEPAFKAEGVPDVLRVQISDKPLPVMHGVTLAEALSPILERIPATSGACFLVERDQLVITTRFDAMKTAGVALCEQSRYLLESFRFLSLGEDSYFVHEASRRFSDVVHWHRVLVDNARHLRDSQNTPQARQEP
jgi:hypothetical protein